MESLEKHFQEKFSYEVDTENEFISEARKDVKKKLDNCLKCYDDFIFTENMMRKCISKLKLGSAPGPDGISGEHLKHAVNTDLILHLCNIFTVCFRCGVVPINFTNGLLVPILKKPTLDPSLATNYRPVIMSNILSKIIELYIIDECNNVKFNDFQFGFVSGRGTNTAIALAHDTASYFNFKGSPLFMCALDAEGAFDGIPHPILFKKAMNVLSDKSWKLLLNWYSNITVQIKWNVTGNIIQICKGTRQGGLSSPLLFNLFYKDLIDELENCDGGATIGNVHFNVFCYADDIVLSSTTASGLQNLIAVADNYIDKHGLRFNPSKTKCIIHGKNPFISTPEWFIKNSPLEICDNISYLGAVIGNGGNNEHINSRLSSCRRAFHSLQGAGLCKQGLNVETAVHVFKATCNSILAYGCESIYLSNRNKYELDKLQGKLIKCIVGLGPRHKTSHLIQALNVNSISRLTDFNSLSLFHNIMKSYSGARKFYSLMQEKRITCSMLLNNRVKNVCDKWNSNFLLSYVSDGYLNNLKKLMLANVKDGSNGTVDSVRYLLRAPSAVNLGMIRLLLKAF